ncbi:MAG: M23 family metallopeptidase [Mariprofundus sp.]|nr:M23 family metallopeptidase [Mariprofundus sp.]
MMSTSSSGALFGIVISRKLLIASLVGVLGSLTFGVWGVVGLMQTGQFSQALKQSEQTLEHARSASVMRFASLQHQLHAEQEKQAVYARTLGQIQARMARLDALGSRLVDVAALDKSEFDFSLEPAFGGPRLQQPAMFVAQSSLRDELHDMDGHLKQLNAQLIAIDYMLENRHAALEAKPHAWPTEGGWISSRFGRRIDPFSGQPAQHYGVDIANRSGAAIVSASRGVVTFAGEMLDFGYVVDIEHGHGYKTRYAHMGDLAVNIGDVVVSNQVVGHIGSSGRSTGPHLHYEVRRFGKLINPKSFLPRG